MDNPSSIKFQDNPIVTLHIGPDRHAFHMHQELLFKFSPVFKAAFSGACRESNEHRMDLPEEDPETVERLVQWLYFKSLGLTKAVCSETSAERYWQLARLNTGMRWVLKMVKAITCMLVKFNSLPQLSTTHEIGKMASTRGIKRKFSDIQMVLLVVGREETEISVHENVLFEASPVFKAAFTSRFKESSERSICLPDDNATLMDILIQLLYARKSRLNGRDFTMELLHLYVLADKYDIVKVKNTVCKHVLSTLEYKRSSSAREKQYTSCPVMSAVEFIYENTTSTAPMRRLLVDWFVWGFDLEWLNNEKTRVGLLSVPEYAVDVCAVLAKDFNKKAKARLFMKESSVYLEGRPIGDKSQIN